MIPNNTHNTQVMMGVKDPINFPHKNIYGYQLWVCVWFSQMSMVNSLTLIQDIFRAFSWKMMNIYGRIESVQHRKS